MFLHAIGFGIVTAAVMALAAVGFTVQFGVTNILNLAYGDVMTASAFVAYASYSAGLNPWWGMVFGGLFGAVFSVLLNRFLYTPFIRRGARLFTMIIVTIAVSPDPAELPAGDLGRRTFSACTSRPAPRCACWAWCSPPVSSP